MGRAGAMRRGGAGRREGPGGARRVGTLCRGPGPVRSEQLPQTLVEASDLDGVARTTL